MKTKQFKAESKRLLELMINSIYTHREIFLRELISNASDAIDRLYYHSLSDNVTGLSREDFAINLSINKSARTLTVSDNGCGMNHDELESNLGTIAQSGSRTFKQEEVTDEHKDDIDIIGQFGVGFYSSFMVSSRVVVISRPFGSDEAWKWESVGTDGYTIEPCEKDTHGTTITLTIKANNKDNQYDDFLDPEYIAALIRQYSDYIRYPIRMDMPNERLKKGSTEDNPKYEHFIENETINSMVPIWKKNKSELTDADYNQFYKDKYLDFMDPAHIIHSSTEGIATYNALLFIPARAPANYYSRDFEKGLQLYANGVMIMDKCPDLLPDCFSFVRGMVDSQDFSLNISRELLQHDRQLKIIAGRLEKKIHSELLTILKKDRPKYEQFWKNFGLQLKFGIYSDYGERTTMLQDLLLFPSTAENKLVTLDEYVSRMKESQKYIYYACGESAEKVSILPQTELLRDQGFEVICLSDDVDEFAIRMMVDFKKKEFKSVTAKDIGVESEADKEDIQKQNAENKGLLDYLHIALGDKVTGVHLSGRLKKNAVCFSSVGEVSLEMEKVLNSMPNDKKVYAQRVLEISASHPLVETMQKLYDTESGRERLNDYATLLYQQAMLIEGMPIDDPVAFSNAICSLMS